MKLKKSFFLYLSILLGGFTFLYISIKIDRKETAKYKDINRDLAFCSEIVALKHRQGASLIVLADRKKIRIPSFGIMNEDSTDLVETLGRGDIIKKQCGTDTLYLIKRGKIFAFQINNALKTTNK